MSDAARLRSQVERLETEIAAHKAALWRHRRQLKFAYVNLAQARAALARIAQPSPAGEEGRGDLHGQSARAQS